MAMRFAIPVPSRVARTCRTAASVLVGLGVTWCLWYSSVGSVHHLDAHGQHGEHGDDTSAAAVCAAHGWQPYTAEPERPRTRQVFDLCMVNDELDWLEIRLNTTYDAVDYFVIVEAPKTFTGLDKPLTIRDNWARFAPYHAKMLYHQLQYPPGFDPPRAWDREDLQRNALFLQVLGGGAAPGGRTAEGAPPPPEGVSLQLGDVLVVADVDEIPRPATLRALRLCRFPRRLTLRSQFFYYSFQFRHRGPAWPHPQATFYDGPDGTVLPVHLRNGDGGRGITQTEPGSSGGGGSGGFLVFRLLRAARDALLRRWDTGAVPDAGWHCSSCFATMGELMHKLESVSHVWMNHPHFRSRDRAAAHVREGVDLWDRTGEVFDRVEDNMDVPSLLLADPERFRYLLSRDGPSAGFSDYPP